MPIAAETRKQIEIPEDVEVNYTDYLLKVKGPNGSLSRNFKHPRVKMEIKNNEVVTYCHFPRKKEKALTGTWAAHVKNMVAGVKDGFCYKMKIVYAHFPVKVKFNKNDSILNISNFIGEKSDREAKIMHGVDVKVDSDEITLSGLELEKVAQSAANIEQATRIKGYDPRVFQDGIYITQKAIRGDVNG